MESLEEKVANVSSVGMAAGGPNLSSVSSEMVTKLAASNEALTLSEQMALTNEVTEVLEKQAEIDASVSRGKAFSEANHDASVSRSRSSLLGAGCERGSQAAAVAAPATIVKSKEANQRERYMRKFERDEIFGKSEEDLEKEKQFKENRQKNLRQSNIRCMLMPDSPFRLGWDAMSILLILYVSIALPYQVAFMMDYVNLGITISDFLLDLFFLTDIVINFRTAILYDGE